MTDPPSPRQAVSEPTTRTVNSKAKWVGVVVIVVALIIASRLLPVTDWLRAFNHWVADLGPWGWIVFILAYAVAAIALLPGSVLTLGAGFSFGLVPGFIVVSLAATLGAAAAFLVARHLARGAISRRFGHSQRFRAVDEAVGREGAKIVFLLRLSPVFPYNALNYLLGLTSVRFWPYVLASWAGMLPGTLLYVYLGYAGRAGIEAAAGGTERNNLNYVYLGAGLVATLGVTVYVTRLAKRALREKAPVANESRRD